MPPTRPEPDLVAQLRKPDADIESLILDAATGSEPVKALLPVVNARGLPNATRIAALDAVSSFATRDDVAELARAAGKQHEDVASKAIKLLAQTWGSRGCIRAPSSVWK